MANLRRLDCCHAVSLGCSSTLVLLESCYVTKVSWKIVLLLSNCSDNNAGSVNSFLFFFHCLFSKVFLLAFVSAWLRKDYLINTVLLNREGLLTINLELVSVTQLIVFLLQYLF